MTTATIKIEEAREVAQKYADDCGLRDYVLVLPSPVAKGQSIIKFWVLERGANLDAIRNGDEDCYVAYVDFAKRKVWIPTFDVAVSF